jgi:hypothetical protein
LFAPKFLAGFYKETAPFTVTEKIRLYDTFLGDTFLGARLRRGARKHCGNKQGQSKEYCRHRTLPWFTRDEANRVHEHLRVDVHQLSELLSL